MCVCESLSCCLCLAAAAAAALSAFVAILRSFPVLSLFCSRCVCLTAAPALHPTGEQTFDPVLSTY